MFCHRGFRHRKADKKSAIVRLTHLDCGISCSCVLVRPCACVAVRPCGNRVKLGICAKTGSPPGSTDGAKCKSVHIFRNAMHLPSSRFFILKICTLLVETPECAAPIGRTELPGRECSDEKESRQTRDSCQSRSPRGSDTEFDAIFTCETSSEITEMPGRDFSALAKSRQTRYFDHGGGHFGTNPEFDTN